MIYSCFDSAYQFMSVDYPLSDPVYRRYGIADKTEDSIVLNYPSTSVLGSIRE